MMEMPSALMAGMQKMLGSVQPPAWLVREIQNRIVLSLNHVLQQEPEAMERLKRQVGKAAQVEFLPWTLCVQITPAGLLELAAPERVAELTLSVQDNMAALSAKLAKGEKPLTQIAGDVQLAADINWLIDHVRWDFEEDLAKLVGDATAHNIGQALRAVAGGLRRFVSSFRNDASV